jgi:nickel transport protein
MHQDLNRSSRVPCMRRWIVYLFSVSLWLVFYVSPAIAHRVTIFAWVEGDTVHTQSKFSQGRAAKGCTVVVYDSEGKQLLEGKTDENGEFSFKVPKRTELKVALKASAGHLAERIIPVEEIVGVAYAAESSVPEVGVETHIQEVVPLTGPKVEKESPVPETVGLSREEVQRLIDESLDRKLAPIINMLTESLDDEPKISDVIAGIGYIFGLVGVALYFRSRGKRS